MCAGVEGKATNEMLKSGEVRSDKDRATVRASRFENKG